MPAPLEAGSGEAEAGAVPASGSILKELENV